MNGIAYKFPWKYRALTDELVLMTNCQVFKLKVYPTVGRPRTHADAQAIAETFIQRDIDELRAEERRQRL